MTNRRDFLHGAAVLGMFSFPTADLVSGMPFADKTTVEDPGWKPHVFRKGDGRGGWIYQSAQYRTLTRPDGRYVMGFGLAAMDSGEVIFAGSWHDGSAESADQAERPVVAFSHDGCMTWTEPTPIEGARGRPVMLTYLGKGELMFQTDLEKKITQFFSHDYGRKWERRPLQLASNGENFSVEGSALVDRATGGRTRISEVGYNLPKERKYPEDPTNALIRWSDDGGHTWNGEASPSVWRWEEHYEGRTYVRSISEGSLARAANGWLVAALRTDMPPRFFKYNNDNLEGIGISVSKDDGKTWSPVQVLYESGRMHAHLLRMPNGTLVLTYVIRQDIEGGKLVSYRRGCGAVVSRDNGQSWDLARGYVLDEFEFADGKLNTTTCGHLFSTTLNDHSILTTYSNYLAKCAVLIRWRPDV
jgi:hypothetical protein